MPILKDLLFGTNGEAGITNPVVKKFLQIHLLQWMDQFNKNLNEQDAIKIRVKIREFNKQTSKLKLEKNQYIIKLLKEIIYPFVSVGVDKLFANFKDEIYLEINRFAVVSGIENSKLRSLLLEFMEWSNSPLNVGKQTQIVLFEPTIEQIDQLNMLISRLDTAADSNQVNAAIQQAFGKKLQKVLIDFASDNSGQPTIVEFDLTLENIAKILTQETYFQHASKIVNSILDSIRAYANLQFSSTPVLTQALKQHIAANPQFQTGGSIFFTQLNYEFVLIPYVDNAEKYALLVDDMLQKVAGGCIAQAKFNGQGIPIKFFSNAGEASNFKNDLYRLAPLNLILEPFLRTILQEYALTNPALILKPEDIKRFNSGLSSLDFTEIGKLGEQLDMLAQAAWQGIAAIPPNNYFSSLPLQATKVLQSQHQQVKSFYLIPDNFLRTQLLLFASTNKITEMGVDIGNNTELFNSFSVHQFMLNIGDSIIENDRFLSVSDLEKLAISIWPLLPGFRIDGVLNDYLNELQRTQALYLVARPELRKVLFKYALSPAGIKFSPSIDKIQELNKLISDNTVISLNTAEDYDSILFATKLSDENFFARSGFAAADTPAVVAEAKRLGPLYQIYWVPLREILIRYAILNPAYVWELSKINELNAAFFTNAFYIDAKKWIKLLNSVQENTASYSKYYDNAKNCFANLIFSIWNDIGANFTEIAKVAALTKLQEKLLVSQKSFLNLEATYWFKKMISGAANLQAWFHSHHLFRDQAIKNLEYYAENDQGKEKFEKRFFTNILVITNSYEENNYRLVLLDLLKTQFISIKSPLILMEKEHINGIFETAIVDLLGLARHYTYNYLLEFDQLLVKEAFILDCTYWGKYRPGPQYLDFQQAFAKKDNTKIYDEACSLLRKLEKIISQDNPEQIAGSLATIFIRKNNNQEVSSNKNIFEKALLKNLPDGGGLSTAAGISRLKGQVRLFQLNELGIVQYSKKILELESSARDSHLSVLGSFDQISWIQWVINLLSENRNLSPLTIKEIEVIKEINLTKDRVKALFTIERTELREALFEFALSPSGKEFFPTVDQVQHLNSLISQHALSSLSPQAFNSYLCHIWSFEYQNKYNLDSLYDLFNTAGGLTAVRTDRVIKEAKRLRNLYLITLPELRNYLIKVAIAIPEFNDWTETKVVQLNDWLYQNAQAEPISTAAVYNMLYEILWKQLGKKEKDNYLISPYNKELTNAVESCNSLSLDLKIFNYLILPLNKLKAWFVTHMTERDMAIQKLAGMAKNNEKTEELYLNFWRDINKITSRQFFSEEQYPDVLKILQQKLNINESIVVGSSDRANEISASVFIELKLAAQYWMLVFLLKENLLDFKFLYHFKVASFLMLSSTVKKFDPAIISKQLQQNLKAEMSNEAICSLLASIFANGSKEFSDLLMTLRNQSSVDTASYVDINTVQGQLRLSQLKIRYFAVFLDSDLAEKDQLKIVEKLGVLTDDQWTEWEAKIINRLAYAKTSKDIIDIVCGKAPECLIEKFLGQPPVLEASLAVKIINQARVSKSSHASRELTNLSTFYSKPLKQEESNISDNNENNTNQVVTEKPKLARPLL